MMAMCLCSQELTNSTLKRKYHKDISKESKMSTSFEKGQLATQVQSTFSQCTS
jgi:hypothetical protein